MILLYFIIFSNIFVILRLNEFTTFGLIFPGHLTCELSTKKQTTGLS